MRGSFGIAQGDFMPVTLRPHAGRVATEGLGFTHPKG
jgi:hypothetical protein